MTLKKISTIKTCLFILNTMLSFTVFTQDYHWKFDDNLVTSTIGYPTTLNGTNSEMFIPGKINKALNFKKNTHSFPYSDNVSIGNTGSYSISFWIKPAYLRDGINEEHFIANKREGVQQFQTFINRLKELEFYLYGNSSQSVRVVPSTKLLVNRWTHVSITISNQTNNRFITIYFNGKEVKKQPFYFSPNTASSKIIFGNKFTTGNINYSFNGSIDGFRINGGRVITDAEIQSLSNKSQSPDYRWKFDEYLSQSENYSTVPIVKDYIGFRDGSIVGEIPREIGRIGYSSAKFSKNEQNYITVNNIETSNTKTYSLSFWIKAINQFPSNSYSILKKRQSKNQYQVTLLSTGQVRFHLWGNSYFSITSNSINLNEWTNIIVTVDNLTKEVSIYKNGISNSSSTITFEPWYGTDQLIIGDKDNLATSDLLLDDLRIYNNKVLTSTTINQIAFPSELLQQIETPIKHQNYYNTTYRLYDYDPNFIPGPVSFDLNNIPYIRKENYVQTLENDKWVRFYFDNAIDQAVPNWNGQFDKSENIDTRIIFDDDGWAYTFISTRNDNINNNNLVLYSTDKCRTWKSVTKKIRWSNVLWETKQVHADLNLPPVLLSSQNVSDSLVKDLDVYFFEKDTLNNELNFKKQITINSINIGVSHSGAPSQFITKGDTSFLVYSKRYDSNQTTVGNPTYIIEIDRNNLPDNNTIENNKTLIGYAGENTTPDGHNYGSLTIDSTGYLHIVMSGHHDQYLKYTKSIYPLNISQFDTIINFGGQYVDSNNNGHTYNSLICDKNNTLHCVTRWTGNKYQFRIAYLTKIENNPWSNIHSLIIPFEDNYHNWYHKLSIDRFNNLYLNYQLSHQILTKEAYSIYVNEYPEDSIEPFSTGYQYTNMKPKFPGILKLYQEPTSSYPWRLATTHDFISSVGDNKKSLDIINIEQVEDFLIYPNPALNYINVVIPKLSSKKSYIDIYDVGGHKINSIELKQVNSRIDISNLSKGIYLIRISSNNLKVKKLIIK